MPNTFRDLELCGIPLLTTDGQSVSWGNIIEQIAERGRLELMQPVAVPCPWRTELVYGASIDWEHLRYVITGWFAHKLDGTSGSFWIAMRWSYAPSSAASDVTLTIYSQRINSVYNSGTIVEKTVHLTAADGPQVGTWWITDELWDFIKSSWDGDTSQVWITITGSSSDLSVMRIPMPHGMLVPTTATDTAVLEPAPAVAPPIVGTYGPLVPMTCLREITYAASVPGYGGYDVYQHQDAGYVGGSFSSLGKSHISSQFSVGSPSYINATFAPFLVLDSLLSRRLDGEASQGGATVGRIWDGTSWKDWIGGTAVYGPSVAPDASTGGTVAGPFLSPPWSVPCTDGTMIPGAQPSASLASVGAAGITAAMTVTATTGSLSAGRVDARRTLYVFTPAAGWYSSDYDSNVIGEFEFGALNISGNWNGSQQSCAASTGRGIPFRVWRQIGGTANLYRITPTTAALTEGAGMVAGPTFRSFTSTVAGRYRFSYRPANIGKRYRLFLSRTDADVIAFDDVSDSAKVQGVSAYGALSAPPAAGWWGSRTYAILDTPTGAWSGHAGEYATAYGLGYAPLDWTFTAAAEGDYAASYVSRAGRWTTSVNDITIHADMTAGETVYLRIAEISQGYIHPLGAQSFGGSVLIGVELAP